MFSGYIRLMSNVYFELFHSITSNEIALFRGNSFVCYLYICVSSFAEHRIWENKEYFQI